MELTADELSMVIYSIDNYVRDLQHLAASYNYLENDKNRASRDRIENQIKQHEELIEKLKAEFHKEPK